MRNAYRIFIDKDHSEGLGVDGRIILEWILGKWGGKVWTGCMHLAQARDQWQAVVNTVMNLRVP
jgi:hypothetical protein